VKYLFYFLNICIQLFIAFIVLVMLVTLLASSVKLVTDSCDKTIGIEKYANGDLFCETK